MSRPRARRRAARAFAVIGMLVVAGAAAVLVFDPPAWVPFLGDRGTEFSHSVERTIQQSVESSERLSVSSVECPESLQPPASTEFFCTVILANGENRRITVRLDGSNVIWMPTPR